MEKGNFNGTRLEDRASGVHGLPRFASHESCGNSSIKGTEIFQRMNPGFAPYFVLKHIATKPPDMRLGEGGLFSS